MDKSEYKNQYILEKNYWWFKGQREIFLKLIDIYLKKKKKLCIRCRLWCGV